MTEPNVFEKKPAVLELEAGSKWWCACGRSKNQPWCDGSHSGTGITPFEVKLSEPARVALCNCKQTKNPPYCDGSHTDL